MKIALGLYLMLLGGQLLVAQSTIPESEDMRFKAQVEKDTVLLRKILSDDLVYTHSNALTETKSDFIHSITSGNITYQAMQPEEGRSIRIFGKAGISNGIVQAKGLLNGNPFDIRLRYTAVYIKKRSVWMLASWQSTRIP